MPNTENYARRQIARNYDYVSLTVAASGTTTGSTLIGGYRHFSLQIPTINSASVTLLGTPHPSATWRAVKNESGTTFTVTASAGSYTLCSANFDNAMAGLYGAKVVLSAAQTGGARTLYLGLKG